MNLSVNVLFNELSSVYEKIKEPFLSQILQKKSPNDQVDLFKPPLFSTEGVVLEANQVYVLTSEQLPEDLTVNGQCLLIMPESLTRLENRKNISVIEVPGASITGLFNNVLRIFAKYTEWDHSLQDLTFSNASLEDFLRESFPIIGNSMSIHNNNFSFIARFGEMPSHDNLSRMQNSSFFDPDFLLRVDDRVDDSVFYSRHLIHYKDETQQQEYYFLNLFNGNTATGRLVVVSDHRPFLPQDEALITHLSKYLETAMSYTLYNGTGKNLRRDSLLEYISGKSHSDDKILHLKTVSPLSKLSDDQHLFCIVCSSTDFELSQQYVAMRLERALPESVCVIYDDRFILLSANRPGQSPEDYFLAAEALFEKYNLISGFSNPFSDFFDLKYCYSEALFTLQQAELRATPKRINLFKDYTLTHILKFGTSVIPARLLCAKCVVDLAIHDKNSAVSYCESLGIYLDTGRNMMESARLLNITRNTLLARLERIMKFVDLDLDDIDNRLYIQISLRVLKSQIPANPAPSL